MTQNLHQMQAGDQTSLQSVGKDWFFDEKFISQATGQLMTDWLDFWHFVK